MPAKIICSPLKLIIDGENWNLFPAVNGKPGAIVPSSYIKYKFLSSVPRTISSFPLALKSAKATLPFTFSFKLNGKPLTSLPSWFITNNWFCDEYPEKTISSSLSSSKLPIAGVPIKYTLVS